MFIRAVLKTLFSIFIASCVALLVITQSALANEEKKDEQPQGIQYVPLKPLILPILNEKKSPQMVVIVVSLETPDAASAETVRSKQPKLTDALFAGLYGHMNKLTAGDGQLIDVVMLKQKMESISNHVLGEGVVSEVLVQGVNQRRL